MNIHSGSKWHNTHTGSERLLEITLDLTDGVMLFGDKWDAMTPTAQHKALQRYADAYIVTAMNREGALSDEYTKERLQKIKDS